MVGGKEAGNFPLQGRSLFLIQGKTQQPVHPLALRQVSVGLHYSENSKAGDREAPIWKPLTPPTPCCIN
ncbi:hypothetical protein SBA4_770031 [Candidatus Sulfopaludibacter sp. SbA4]|nr:hypothetical protein SBA4_770031 [Candidatus Sulfopaludibacter sp. SbA4]